MSNMYPEYEGKTINFITGGCPHGCLYCYVKSFRFPLLKKRYSGKQKLDEAAFKKNLGKNNLWFVCSCNDINTIDIKWEVRILNHLRDSYPDNTYLIQSKYPPRFSVIDDSEFPPNTILGITAETDKDYDLSKAPQPADRLIDFTYLDTKFPKMISIEPIMDFDLVRFVELIRRVHPSYVSIGADSKSHNLTEPDADKTKELISELKAFTEVRIKPNMKRLIGDNIIERNDEYTCTCYDKPRRVLKWKFWEVTFQ